MREGDAPRPPCHLVANSATFHTRAEAADVGERILRPPSRVPWCPCHHAQRSPAVDMLGAPGYVDADGSCDFEIVFIAMTTLPNWYIHFRRFTSEKGRSFLVAVLPCYYSACELGVEMTSQEKEAASTSAAGVWPRMDSLCYDPVTAGAEYRVPVAKASLWYFAQAY